MDFLSVVATCSLHSDVTLIIAMGMTFGHGNPYTVQNLAEGQVDSYAEEQQEDSLRLPVPGAAKALRTRAEAEAQLRSVVASEGAPVVGLLPVPVSWAAEFGRRPIDLFNPCINVSIATAKLSEFEYECGKRGRTCVLKKYARAAEMDEFEQDVLDELAVAGLSKQGSAVVDDTAEMLSSPVKAATAEERDRQWGADRLFFVLPSTTTSTSTPGAKSGSHEAVATPSKPKK